MCGSCEKGSQPATTCSGSTSQDQCRIGNDLSLSGALIRRIPRARFVPKEIKSKEQIEKLLDSATEIRIARHGDEAKVKLRTREELYTFKTSNGDADELIKGTKTPVFEY
jgi:hypothetical protein